MYERIFEKWNKDRNGASRRVKYTWDELVVRARLRERERREGGGERVEAGKGEKENGGRYREYTSTQDETRTNAQSYLPDPIGRQI